MAGTELKHLLLYLFFTFSCFKLKILGIRGHCLGMNIKILKNKMCISQDKLFDKTL